MNHIEKEGEKSVGTWKISVFKLVKIPLVEKHSFPNKILMFNKFFG